MQSENGVRVGLKWEMTYDSDSDKENLNKLIKKLMKKEIENILKGENNA